MNETEPGTKLPDVADTLLEKLKNTFLQDYSAVSDYQQGVIFKSTKDICTDFYRVYPNEILYGPADIAQFLNENGYAIKNMGELRYEWMLMPTILIK